jgi:hypothetical protein
MIWIVAVALSVVRLEVIEVIRQAINLGINGIKFLKA